MVLLPVKTGATDGWQVQARSGSTGALLYTLFRPTTRFRRTTGRRLYRTRAECTAEWIGAGKGEFRAAAGDRDYAFEALHSERLYYSGAGGTVYYRDEVDSATGPTGQIAFYGNALYAANAAAFNASVQISTPLTADSSGNIYFGYMVEGPNPANLTSGIARIASDGTGTWMGAQAFPGGDSTITQVASNCAPALSRDERAIYFAVSNGGEFGTGYLVSADSTTLAPEAQVKLFDPRGSLATISTRIAPHRRQWDRTAMFITACWKLRVAHRTTIAAGCCISTAR